MEIDGKGVHAGSVPSRDKMGLTPAVAETATNTRFSSDCWWRTGWLPYVIYRLLLLGAVLLILFLQTVGFF